MDLGLVEELHRYLPTKTGAGWRRPPFETQ
jgi:hypothetical protein